VKSWDGAAWTSVGGVLNVNPSRIAQLPSIASVAGTPYVAWEEYAGSFVEQVHVARWTGSAWSAVGGILNVDPTKHAESVTIAGVGGTPFVTWQDESTAGKGQVYVARWTGSAWSAIGGALSPDGEGYSQSPRVAAVGGVPFVAWDDEDAGGIRHARVVRLAVDVLDQHATRPQPAPR
jgi:hypothetical protein